MSDDIELLPVNKGETLAQDEAARLKPYVGASASAAPNGGFLETNKKYIYIVVAFLLLSIPFLDGMMSAMIGAYWWLLVKAVIFTVVVVLSLRG